MMTTEELPLFSGGFEEYPKKGVIFANVTMALWFAMGTASIWFIEPYAALSYLAFALLMVGVVMRKLICPNCYYHGKRCSMGWGKLSSLMFKRGSMDKFKTSTGMKLAPAFYAMMALVPLICISYALYEEVTTIKIAILVLLLMISAYNSSIARTTSCARCKMRLICPGSAVKAE